jgi:hypothetical protein
MIFAPVSQSCASQSRLKYEQKLLAYFLATISSQQETETILKSKRAILSVLTDESLSLSHPNPSSLYLPKVD